MYLLEELNTIEGNMVERQRYMFSSNCSEEAVWWPWRSTQLAKRQKLFEAICALDDSDSPSITLPTNCSIMKLASIGHQFLRFDIDEGFVIIDGLPSLEKISAIILYNCFKGSRGKSNRTSFSGGLCCSSCTLWLLP